MLYKEMTPDEQLKWVTDFSAFVTEKLPILESLGDAWETAHIKDMETGLNLINAFSYAQRFVSKTIAMGDYVCRVNRLRHYVEQIKEEISAGTTVVGADGKKYAYIPALQQQRRRGRPSAEQKANEQTADSTDTKKEQKIAALMGQEIITATPRREKNNEELAQERAEREAEKAKQQPSLFGEEVSSLSGNALPDTGGALPDTVKAIGHVVMPDAEQMPHLSDLKFLMTDEMREKVDSIRGLRASAAASAERAKLLAEQGADASVIMPYVQEAADYTEQYENIYGLVDAVMAECYIRLKEDEKYKAEWSGKADVKALEKMLRPYYNKMVDGFADTVRKKIAEEQPEVVARKEKEKADKKEVSAIIKYLRRTDKPNTAKRIKGMEQKYQQLVALIGEEEAKAYLPLIEKAKEELKAKTESL